MNYYYYYYMYPYALHISPVPSLDNVYVWINEQTDNQDAHSTNYRKKNISTKKNICVCVAVLFAMSGTLLKQINMLSLANSICIIVEFSGLNRVAGHQRYVHA